MNLKKLTDSALILLSIYFAGPKAGIDMVGHLIEGGMNIALAPPIVELMCTFADHNDQMPDGADVRQEMLRRSKESDEAEMSGKEICEAIKFHLTHLKLDEIKHPNHDRLYGGQDDLDILFGNN